MLNIIIESLFRNISDRLISNSEKVKISIALEEYVSKLYDRLAYTKTILSRDMPMRFYDTYIPLTLESKDTSIRLRRPEDVLSEYRNLAIIGSAGCGKTTLLRFLTLRSIDDNYTIPVYIELRRYNSDLGSFENFVAMQISSDHKESICSLFTQGNFTFIFDGYDEINYKEGHVFIDQLENFLTNYSRNNFVISSRPGTNLESISKLFVFNIRPLNMDDIYILISKLNVPNVHETDIFDIFNSDEFFKIYLTNPLYLSLYIKYVNENSAKNLPHKHALFFRNILDSTLSTHDSISKLAFVRNRLSGLGKDDLELISSVLAFRSFLLSRFDFTKDDLYKEFEIIKRTYNLSFDKEKLIYDLTITTNLLLENGNSFSFPHVLLSEYLGSLFISRLDSTSKKAFYSRLIKDKRVYFSVSMLNFLFELDKKPFIECFLIPSIEKISKLSYYDEDYHGMKNSLDEFINQRNGHSKSHYGYNHDYQEILENLNEEISPNSDDNLGEIFQS